jgi:GntR family transcriptional regulator, transcriptional repressor for pyruvate dehydrogenase complex
MTGGERRPRTFKIPEVLAREILDNIVSRKLGPGDRLPPEAVMTEQYEVGRGSLREALRILEILGMITLKPGPRGGPMVAGIDSSDYARTATFYYHAKGGTVRDLLYCRMALEPAAVRVIAERKEQADIQKLREVIAGEVEMTASAQSAEWSLDIQFHHLMAKLSNNPILELSCSSLVDAHYQRMRNLPPAPRKQQVLIARMHSEIVDSAEAGDAYEAERLMREHIGNMVKYLENRYPAYLREVVAWQ